MGKHSDDCWPACCGGQRQTGREVGIHGHRWNTSGRDRQTQHQETHEGRKGICNDRRVGNQKKKKTGNRTEKTKENKNMTSVQMRHDTTTLRTHHLAGIYFNCSSKKLPTFLENLQRKKWVNGHCATLKQILGYERIEINSWWHKFSQKWCHSKSASQTVEN